MTKKLSISDRWRVWIDARRRFHLSHAHIQMTRAEQAKKEAKLARKAARAALGAGIAWYAPEQWKRLLDLAEDRETLEETHAQWRVDAEELLSHMQAQGALVRRVPVDVEAMQAWCREQGLPFTSAGRANYVSFLLQKEAGEKVFSQDRQDK